MIRRAKISEIPDILTITQACAQKMQDNGIFQWNEHYPNEKAFAIDVDRGELSRWKKTIKLLGPWWFLHGWMRNTNP